jgi:hypothetical protein
MTTHFSKFPQEKDAKKREQPTKVARAFGLAVDIGAESAKLDIDIGEVALNAAELLAL